nr:hypothetical protein [Tanacetum cinerariifolium]
MAALLYKDDHNKVAYLEKGKGWESYEHILDFLNRSHIRYALTHRLTIVFDSLVKQFWATATVRTLKAGPFDIIATINGNEVVVTESLIRTQLQLDDVNGLYEFTLHDVLDGMRAIGFIIDGMIRNIRLKRHKFPTPSPMREPTPDSPRHPSPFRSTSTTRRRLRKPFTSFASAHVSENIPASASVPAAATTIPTGSSVDADVHAATAPSSSIPTAADKGKAPMVDDSLPADLLSDQEHVLKIFMILSLERRYDVTEENMNERLGMLLLRKRRELADQSWVKPMTKTQQRDHMRDFVKNNSALVYNQVHAATSSALVDILVPAVSPALAPVSVPAETVIHTAESHLDDPLTASEHVSSEPTVAAPTPLSSRKHHKHISKKRVTPIVDMADAAMIKFDSDTNSDDDPLPYAPYADWEMVLSPLGSVHAYHDMARNTKHFTTLHELLHMVEKTDLQKLLGAVDKLYQKEESDTFALLLWGDLHVLFQSLDDENVLDFWRNQDSWRIRSWRLYPHAQVHVLETVDGRVIHMFVDVSYPLTVATLERMLKHILEVPKLLVGGVLSMAEQLIGFIKAALLNAQSAI